jgi:hypothetical protein
MRYLLLFALLFVGCQSLKEEDDLRMKIADLKQKVEDGCGKGTTVGVVEKVGHLTLIVIKDDERAYLVKDQDIEVGQRYCFEYEKLGGLAIISKLVLVEEQPKKE